MPRAWPPVSVWLAVWLLLGPPTTLFGYALAPGRGNLGRTGLAGMVCGTVLAVGLLRRSAAAVDIGVVYAGVVGPGAVVLALGQFVVTPSEWATLTPQLIVAGWSVGVVGVLNWPETRRWCGLLPPADPDVAD